MPDYKLSADRVTEIFQLCFVSNQKTEDTIEVLDGVSAPCYFSIIGINYYKDEIDAMLMQLPDEFMASKGGGYSFMYAAHNNKGEHWADLHASMAALFNLGLATSKVKLLLPREYWDILPGGMPYYAVNDQ